MSTPLSERIAAAPISWGVCEVPGWGHQLAPDTVLAEMADLGLRATEFGPQGFLPEAPDARAAVLREHGLAAVGQFVPVVLHDPDHDPLPEVDEALTALLAAGATTVVLAAATGTDGYDRRPALDDAGWATLLAHLDRLASAAAARGVVATLHPHVGTMVETGEDTDRVLAGSSIGLCLDTGHLLIGGGDPARVARDHPDRVAHVHLKDVRLGWAERVRSGAVTYTEAVAGGLYVPLGAGDADIAGIVGSLEDHGYAGWYVLEQDTILGEPAAAGNDASGEDAAGIGPARDVRASRDFLLALAAGRHGAGA